jgi:hypothetical protein
MRRREFVTLLGGAAAWPLAARGQRAAKVYRVGLVFTTSPVSEMVGTDPIHPLARSFVYGLRTLGYLQGQNLVLEHRSAEGKFERFPEIMAGTYRRQGRCHRDGGKSDDSGRQGRDWNGPHRHGL